MRLTFLFGLILLFSKLVQAQSDYRPGFIITLKKDSVPGFILYKENASRFLNCSYRKELNGETTEYDPTQLSAYGFKNDRYYASKELTIDTVYGNYFAEVLAYGKASLLRINYQFYLEDGEGLLHELTKTVEVENETGRVVQTKEKYKGILNWKFSDCNKISGHIKALELDERSLIKIFELYNSCFGFEQKSVKSLKPWSEVHVGLSGGLFTTTLNRLDDLPYYSSLNPEQFKKDKGLFGGLSMRFIFPRISERLNVNIDLFYKKGSHESFQENPDSYETVYLEYSAIQAPVSFGYIFNNSGLSIKPTFEIGLNFDFTINSSSYWQYDFIQSNTVTTEKEDNIVTTKEIAVSPFIGMGAYKGIGKKMQAFTRFRYQFGTSNIDSNQLVVPQQSLIFTVGILMKVSK